MRVVFMYDQSEPTKGSITPGSLPNAQAAFKGYQPLLITQRMHDGQQLANRNMLADATATGNSNNNNIVTSNQLHILEVLNEDVQMPLGDDTSYWCKVFEFEDFSQKQHLIKVSVWKTDSRKSFLIQFSRFVVDLCRRNALSVRHNCAPHRKWKEQWRTIFRCVYFFFWFCSIAVCSLLLSTSLSNIPGVIWVVGRVPSLLTITLFRIQRSVCETTLHNNRQ